MVAIHHGVVSSVVGVGTLTHFGVRVIHETSVAYTRGGSNALNSVDVSTAPTLGRWIL